jgi:hypothetical protein
LWDGIEKFCPHIIEDMNKKLNTNSEAVSLSTEYKDDSEVSTQSGGTSGVTITLIVVGVLLVCAVGGGVIWVRVVKGRRDRPKTPEYCDVYAPRVSYASIHSYAEIGVVQSYVSVQSETDVDTDSRNATGYSYETVH